MFFFNVLERIICDIIFIFVKSDFRKASYKNLNKFLDTEITFICEKANLNPKHVCAWIVKPMCNHIDINRNKRILYDRPSHDALYAFDEYDFFHCYADMLSAYQRYWRARGFYIDYCDREILLTALLKRGYEKNYFTIQDINDYKALSRKVNIQKIPHYTSDSLKFVCFVLFVLIPLIQILFIFLD